MMSCSTNSPLLRLVSLLAVLTCLFSASLYALLPSWRFYRRRKSSSRCTEKRCSLVVWQGPSQTWNPSTTNACAFSAKTTASE